jgi:soluble lytic murein transglycosylase
MRNYLNTSPAKPCNFRILRVSAVSRQMASLCILALAAALIPGKAALAEPKAPGAAATPKPQSSKTQVATSPAPTGEKTANRPVIPKPDSPSKAELEHIRTLDDAIAPIRAYRLDPADAGRIRDAIKAVAASDLDKAQEIKGSIQDPVGRKLVDWYRLRSGYGEPSEYRAFLDANPAWPDRTGLTQKLEEALFTSGGSAGFIKSQFAKGGPNTGAGLAALASAYVAEGNDTEAKRYAVKVWREENLSAALEPGFLARFGKYLTPADHKWRLDRLLIDTLRWDGEKKARADLVRRVIPMLAPSERKKAEARLAVFMGAANAKKLVDALPAENEPDWGLVFQRIQTLRRANKTEEAAKLMLGAPTEEAKIVVPDEWWVERRANAYEALKAGKPKLAYELVREAGPLSENPLKDQTFMAGWLALRYLKKPDLAETHFLAMNKAADGPLSRAKASYWLGRTAEAKGDKARATEYYRAALRDPDAFHALLARQKLEPGRQPITTSPPTRPTPEQIRAFVDLDAVKAVVVAKKAGLDISIMRSFIVQLRIALKSEAEAAMVAHLAEAIGDTQSALRAGKTAIARGQNLYYYAYPVHPFPAYSALRKPPEPAFLLGIARQETEFNTLTVSGAGAKGLLQVMTITAKHVCHDYKIKCDIGRLLTDPSYNTMLASAYIADRMDEFSGSYILTIAGYNAGPGRARQWIREFGDPRDPNVDPIDWIERIPIQETREYVGKVLANIQMYRARLGEERAALRLEDDLNRARVAGRAKAQPQSGAAATASSESDG